MPKEPNATTNANNYVQQYNSIQNKIDGKCSNGHNGTLTSVERLKIHQLQIK